MFGSTVLPQLKNVALIINEGVKPNLRFLSCIGRHFELVGVSGWRSTGQLYFNDVEGFWQVMPAPNY